MKDAVCEKHGCWYVKPDNEQEKLIGECPWCLKEERDRLKEVESSRHRDLDVEMTEEFTERAVDSLHKIMIWEACGASRLGKISHEETLGLLRDCKAVVQERIDKVKALFGHRHDGLKEQA
jgi:hypothetical protein